MEPKLTFSQWVEKLSKRYYYMVSYTDRRKQGLLGYKVIETKEQGEGIETFKSTYPDLIWTSIKEVDESYKDRHLTYHMAKWDTP